MFTLATKLIEILASAGTRLLARQRDERDAEVVRSLLGLVLLLQELCVRGERVLRVAGRFADQTADEAATAEFDQMVAQQVATIQEIRDEVAAVRPLLATVDAGLYLKLAPFLDVKSGLLTRWEQQRRTSAFSSTTLFFLPATSIDRLAAAGEAGASVDGLGRDRAEFVMATADAIRATRTTEIRDIRNVGAQQAEPLRAGIDAAKADLALAGKLCARLLAAIEESVGTSAMAQLRRTLIRDSQADLHA